MQFGGRDYHHETFEGLDLRRQAMVDAVFDGCTFEQCQFNEASLTRSRFAGCVFFRCDLSMADLGDVELFDVQFESSALIGVNWSLLARRGPLDTELVFRTCTLNYTTFRGMALSGSTFETCLMREAAFDEVTLRGASFRGSNLRGTTFERCDLSGADFEGAKDYRISVLTNKVKGAKFSFPEVVGLLAGLEIELS